MYRGPQERTRSKIDSKRVGETYYNSVFVLTVQRTGEPRVVPPSVLVLFLLKVNLCTQIEVRKDFKGSLLLSLLLPFPLLRSPTPVS